MKKRLLKCPKCGSEPSGEADRDGYELHCCGISSGLQNSDFNACEAWNEAVLLAASKEKE